MRRLRSLLHCLILGLSLAAADAAHAAPVQENDMKAAYLYNFALYTNWPSSLPSVLNLCVLGSNGLNGALDKINGKQVNARRLSVTYNPALQGIWECHLLFAPEGSGSLWGGVSEELKKTPVLTITDDPSLNGGGMMIGMFVENRRLVFEVDSQAAQQAGLSFSSKMLSLARKVK